MDLNQNFHDLTSKADSAHPRQVWSHGTAPVLHRFPYSLVIPNCGQHEHMQLLTAYGMGGVRPCQRGTTQTGVSYGITPRYCSAIVIISVSNVPDTHQTIKSACCLHRKLIFTLERDIFPIGPSGGRQQEVVTRVMGSQSAVFVSSRIQKGVSGHVKTRSRNATGRDDSKDVTTGYGEPRPTYTTSVPAIAELSNDGAEMPGLE